MKEKLEEIDNQIKKFDDKVFDLYIEIDQEKRQNQSKIVVDYEVFEPVYEQKGDQITTDDLRVVFLKERNKNQELFDEIEELKNKYNLSDEE